MSSDARSHADIVAAELLYQLSQRREPDLVGWADDHVLVARGELEFGPLSIRFASPGNAEALDYKSNRHERRARR